MVKKLIKHEFIYYWRTFCIFLPIVILMGIMTRVFHFFGDDNIIGEIAAYSSTTMLIVSSIALIILSTVIGVVRFYKNMYSAEGYLTFTLPVTHHQHILVKLGFALACQLVSILTIFIAIGIGSWDVPVGFNIFKILSFEILAGYVGKTNAALYVIEGVMLILLGSVFNVLLYYGCITVGQTAKKNRILMAFGAYFIYYVATQVISTVLSIIFMVLGMSGALDQLTVWMENNFTTTIHIYLWIAIVIYAVMSAVFYFITHRIMSKKLNLE